MYEVCMKISKHFQERWLERVGLPIPTVKTVKQMIKYAVCLQKDSTFYTRVQRYKWPALYWVADKNLVLKIDEEKKTAITVLTSGINRIER